MGAIFTNTLRFEDNSIKQHQHEQHLKEHQFMIKRRSLLFNETMKTQFTSHTEVNLREVTEYIRALDLYTYTFRTSISILSECN